MSMMKHLLAQINDEIEGAKEYASFALKFKDDDRELSTMYCSMAKAELGHYNNLDNQIVKMLDKYYENEDKRYSGFEEMYEWKKSENLAKIAEVNLMLDMCK